MSKLFKVSIGIYVLVGAFYVLLGFIYITTPEYMPYHTAATQTPWDQLDKGFQGLFLGFLKLGGAGLGPPFITNYYIVTFQPKS